ncbi:MAG: hypothetical protein RJA78_84 [Actinomycetota bacterium]
MSSDSLVLTKLAGLLRSGVALPKAIKIIGGLPVSNLGLSYLLGVAIRSGASVAAEIEVVAELSENRERALERIAIAYAGPKASSRLVIWLPVVTVLIAQLSGVDLLATVVDRPALAISILLGIALLAAAKVVSSSLLRRAMPEQDHPGYFLMAVALASGGGANLNKAQRLAFEEYEVVFGREPAEDELLAMAEISNLVETTGARVSDLLRAQARNLQRQQLTRNELKIERLGVRLMFPLGLAVLPAFVCLAVIPLMASMFGPS